MTKEKQIQLKVVEALQDDAYKGIARIDVEVMRQLEIRRGDAILIKGKNSTVAIADRAFPADVGEGIIRIDKILRRNAKVEIGELVNISKVEIKEAKKVIIAPAQKGIMIQADPEGLRKLLLGRVVIKGDIIVLGGVPRKDLMSEESGDMEDIFGNLGEILGGMGFGELGNNKIKFAVVSVEPKSHAIITSNTNIEFDNKPVFLLSEEEFRKTLSNNNRIIRIKKLPTLDSFYEVENFEEMEKLLEKSGSNLIKYYENDGKEYYFLGEFLYIYKKK